MLIFTVYTKLLDKTLEGACIIDMGSTKSYEKKYFHQSFKNIFILFLFCVFSPLVTNADESGTCGENLTWDFKETTGILTISGTGEMDNFNSSSQPWVTIKDDVHKIIICDGVTSIGRYAFNRCLIVHGGRALCSFLIRSICPTDSSIKDICYLCMQTDKIPRLAKKSGVSKWGFLDPSQPGGF